jgi:hypothetical protein
MAGPIKTFVFRLSRHKKSDNSKINFRDEGAHQGMTCLYKDENRMKTGINTRVTNKINYHIRNIL